MKTDINKRTKYTSPKTFSRRPGERIHQKAVKLTEREMEGLHRYCCDNAISWSDGIRAGINKLIEEND